MFEDMSYEEVYQSFRFGTITEYEWQAYCEELLYAAFGQDDDYLYGK